jgi:GGDEF domain-containing protein
LPSPKDLGDAPPDATGVGWFDLLTQLPGPAFWEAVLAAEAARWARYHRPATIVLAEVVGLGSDGRAGGGDVARRQALMVGRTLRSGCRASDYLARLDDTRFAVLLTETDEIAAINMVERVRASCERALRAFAGDAWVAFGWASPALRQPLLGALETAEGRLRREAASGAPR